MVFLRAPQHGGPLEVSDLLRRGDPGGFDGEGDGKKTPKTSEQSPKTSEKVRLSHSFAVKNRRDTQPPAFVKALAQGFWGEIKRFWGCFWGLHFSAPKPGGLQNTSVSRQGPEGARLAWHSER